MGEQLLSSDPKAGQLLSTDAAAAEPKKAKSTTPVAAAVSSAIPAMRVGAEHLATAPNAWKKGKLVGELLGLVGGWAKGGPIGAAGGMWVGGKAGWRLTNAAQRLAAPASKLLAALEPFSLPMSALASEGAALQQLNDPDELARIGRILGVPKKKDDSAFRAWVDANKIQDVDAADSYYDYRAAFRAGATRDATGHWPSDFKLPGHPRMVVGGFNVQTWEPVGPQQDGFDELVQKGWDPKIAKILIQGKGTARFGQSAQEKTK